jgi:hypothetical protein
MDAARVSDLACGGGTAFMRPTLSKVSAGKFKSKVKTEQVLPSHKAGLINFFHSTS